MGLPGLLKLQTTRGLHSQAAYHTCFPLDLVCMPSHTALRQQSLGPFWRMLKGECFPVLQME